VFRRAGRDSEPRGETRHVTYRLKSRNLPKGLSRAQPKGFLLKNGWVYILKCADDSYYTGSTSDIEQRVAQHNTGFFSGYTAHRRPVQVVFVQQFNDIADAIRAETQIKG